MGCTSSAPNMAPNANSTEIFVNKNEVNAEQATTEVVDVNDAGEDSERKELKVLPSCDTLAETIKLDSNNKSMVETSNLELDKDLHKNETVDSGNTIQDRESPHIEEKLSSLEDVVEKIVELYVADNILMSSNHVVPEQKEETVTTKENEKGKGDSSPKVDEPEDRTDDKESETNEQPDEISEETLSPSQSTSSRATRWEALADIAAELPPSLAVDPLTGQIYSLSK